MAEGSVRALIVDDDDFTRFLLVRTLTGFGYLATDAATAADALRLATGGDPFDVAVLDLDLGRGPHGIDLAHALRKKYPSIAIMLLTSYDDPRLIGAHQGLPVGGVQLSKKLVGEETILRDTIETILEHPCSDANRAAGSSATPVGLTLSDNQVEIMRLVAEGHSNAEIGRRQHLTERAVAKAVSRLVKQLDLEVGPDDNVRVLIAQQYYSRIGTGRVRHE